MIEKIFTNEQSMDHLDYAITCGFCFEKFIYGKGMYGNRVSLIRPKAPEKLYTEESDFKNSDFHAVEGIKSLEIAQTILITRQKLESVLTNKACMHDFLSNFSSSFMSKEDLDATVDKWYENVGKKLLGNKMTDFKKLNNFVLANMVLNLPFNVLQVIGKHRQKQLLDMLTQDIITAEFTKSRLNLIPDTQEQFVSLRQKLMVQRTHARMNKFNEQSKVRVEEIKKMISDKQAF